ncbi:hypothetical protein [Propionimicrobium lymphophilum]|uniref:hypothetical protein n=1 Tax=Propionimicrobium lymphophilum TaxID=33012 RepID=UPI00048C8EDB|nr:hypothetical protein [Propionimicrobium lymphophilum]
MHLLAAQFFSAFAFGLLASMIPVFNAETFIAATLATDLIDPFPLGIGLGLGQGIGKAVLFQLVRQGKKIAWLRKRNVPSKPSGPGKWRKRWLWLVAKAESLITHKKLGPVVIFCSGALSIPPNYPTTLIAGAAKANAVIFSSMMTLGYIARNLIEAFLLAGALSAWF